MYSDLFVELPILVCTFCLKWQQEIHTKIVAIETVTRIYHLQLDNRQTPHSPGAINLPKHSPDNGLSEI